MIDKVRLGDVVEFQRGYDLPHASVVSGPYPVIASTSVFAYHNEFKAEDGIVIGRSGTVGQPQLVRGKFWPHNTTLFTTDIKGNNLEYLYYCLVNLDIGKMKTGSNIPTLNRNDLYPLEIPFETDVNTQRKIAEILSAIDAKIDNNNAICADLEGMAKLLYDYWFVQFDFPDENGKPYKSSGGKMVWNEELKREIPEGWEVSELKHLCKYVSEKSADGFEYGKYITTDNMLQDMKGIEISNAIPSATSTAGNFQKSDILVSNIRPYFKKIWFASFDGKASTDVLVFRARNDIAPEYLYHTLARNAFFDYVMHGSKGSKMPRGDKDHIMRYKVVVPPRELVQRVIPLLKNSLAQKAITQTENADLSSLRDFLLPMLMNGQVKVKGA